LREAGLHFLLSFMLVGVNGATVILKTR